MVGDLGVGVGKSKIVEKSWGVSDVVWDVMGYRCLDDDVK